jgi:hypothetical protein
VYCGRIEIRIRHRNGFTSSVEAAAHHCQCCGSSEGIVIMGSGSVGGIDRRRLLGLAAVGGVVAVAAPGAALAAPELSGGDRIPPDARPGGAYDRFVAELAAQDRFSGVVLLSYRGRTVLSRSYGMADGGGGISANWNIYLDTGWVGVVLSNYDDIPLLEILGRETQAITGQPTDPPGGG